MKYSKYLLVKIEDIHDLGINAIFLSKFVKVVHFGEL